MRSSHHLFPLLGCWVQAKQTEILDVSDTGIGSCLGVGEHEMMHHGVKKLICHLLGGMGYGRGNREAAPLMSSRTRVRPQPPIKCATNQAGGDHTRWRPYTRGGV